MIINFKNNQLLEEENIEIIEENHYRINVSKAGEYNLRVCAGDEEDEGDVNVYVTINGEKQEAIWVYDKRISEKVYKVTSQDGFIDIKFEGKYVCIQRIDIGEKITEIPKLVGAADVKMIFGKPFAYVELVWNTDSEKCMLTKTFIDSDEESKQLKAHGTGFIDEDAFLGETYEYEVRAVDPLKFDGENSNKVRITIKDNTKTPENVNNLMVDELSENAVKLFFEKHEEHVFYRIYKKPELGNYKLVDVVEFRKGQPVIKENSALENSSRVDNEVYIENGKVCFVDHNVYTDREYIYGVEAVCLGGISDMATIKSRAISPRRKRQMERLDRGAVAIKVKEGVFVSWRLCADEYDKNATFNVYLNDEKVNENVIDGATNYLIENADITMDSVVEVKMVLDGIEEGAGYKTNIWKDNYLDIPINKPMAYTTPDGKTYEYTANDASVADLDGDGEYEIVLKWDCNGKDNAHKGYSGEVYLDGYKLDGTQLFRISMGKNIRCGAHYTQFMVYDFDGDGKSEIVVKTADGTVDGLGNIIGNEAADYRNADGYIIEGPEYLSLFSGEDGHVLDTVEYDPARGNVADYGDSWGNRVDRFLACVAYLDGVHPSVVMCRGYYDRGRPTNLVAYDVTKDKKLKKIWKFRADSTQNINYTNQGFHNLAVADVDGDGCDEIVYGACVIDHDGTPLYSTGLGHGDAMHLGRFTPDSVGFDYFGIHEDSDCPYGIEARNAGTGEITFGRFTGRDTTRGITAKIDPRYKGNQMWAYIDGLYNYADGKLITENKPASANFAIWWDGDLLRELFDHDWFGYDTNVGIPKIYKWDYINEKLDIIFSTDGVLSNNGTKGNPCIQASIFGDWREELILRGKDSTYLRVYTTTEITKYRFYTFMHDYVYRLGIAWQNTAYNQPPHTSFYIGPDMKGIPKAEIFAI